VSSINKLRRAEAYTDHGKRLSIHFVLRTPETAFASSKTPSCARNALGLAESGEMGKSDGQTSLSSVKGGQLLKITSPANWIALVGLLILLAGGLFWSVFGKLAVTVSGQVVLLPAEGVGAVRAIKPGLVSKLLVEQGDSVSTDEEVAQLVPIDGETELVSVASPIDGFILQRLASKGSFVEAGESLYTLGVGESKNLGAWLFIPFEDVSSVEVGMVVHLAPIAVSSDQSGYLQAKVTKVERFPANEQRLLNVFGNDPRWANFLLGDEGPKALLHVSLDRGTGGEYLWTMGDDNPPSLEHGMMCEGHVRVSSDAPIDSVMPKSKAQ
jgi:hypothetical protein